VLGETPRGRRQSPPATQSHQLGADHSRLVPCDEQISWATAERTAPDLARAVPVGYSVIAWIDGKEKVYGSIP
jgi:hypothetical protein